MTAPVVRVVCALCQGDGFLDKSTLTTPVYCKCRAGQEKRAALYERGWYGMACWNALSHDQQRVLIEVGVLPMGRKVPEGHGCHSGAAMSIEGQMDKAPGARFYCVPCGVQFLSHQAHGSIRIEFQDD
jgi:hypothetical protein